MLLGALVVAVVVVEPDFDELPQPVTAITAKATAATTASLRGAVLSLLILIAFVLVLNVVARAFYARSRKRMGA